MSPASTGTRETGSGTGDGGQQPKTPVLRRFHGSAKIDAARLLVHQAAWLKDQKKDFVKAAAMAKLFASQIAQEVTTEAVQIHGGYGYVKEYHVERLMRDAKITQIYEGTTEIQKLVISRELLR